jgi:phosphatidylserine/phosphatidylglycerophosphate/cardiolipin synthase-like enzyme
MTSEQQLAEDRVLQALALDALRFGQVCAALWAVAGRTIGLTDLDWARRIWGERGPQLLWEALHAAGALTSPPAQLAPIPLAALIAQWAAACAPGRTNSATPLPTAIVTTLPPEFRLSARPGGSLKQALIDVIDQAHTTLILCTPYLDRIGTGYLLDALRAAALRNVAITIITHELHNPQSPNAQAVALLRHELAGAAVPLQCYTVPLAAKTGEPAIRIHAKVLVADARVALIGSANITGAGLGQNLEVGVRVIGPDAARVGRLLDRLCAIQLVVRVD